MPRVQAPMAFWNPILVYWKSQILSSFACRQVAMIFAKGQYRVIFPLLSLPRSPTCCQSKMAIHHKQNVLKNGWSHVQWDKAVWVGQQVIPIHHGCIRSAVVGVFTALCLGGCRPVTIPVLKETVPIEIPNSSLLITTVRKLVMPNVDQLCLSTGCDHRCRWEIYGYISFTPNTNLFLSYQTQTAVYYYQQHLENGCGRAQRESAV